MHHFQDNFKITKRLFISAFSICMTELSRFITALENNEFSSSALPSSSLINSLSSINVMFSFFYFSF